VKGSKSSKSPKSLKSSKKGTGKKGDSSRLIVKQSATSKARTQVGAGVAFVGMVGFVVLIAVKSLGRDPANDAVTESAALLDAAQSDDASEAAAMQA